MDFRDKSFVSNVIIDDPMARIFDENLMDLLDGFFF